MKTYVMVMQTVTLGLGWSYEFESASNETAREYAKRHIPQLAQIPWFMALVVFEKAENRAIGCFKASSNVEVIELKL